MSSLELFTWDLDHIAIQCLDIEKSLYFYCEILGYLLFIFYLYIKMKIFYISFYISIFK